MLQKKMWPCYFFDSDTTGEKPFEEFYTNSEVFDLDRFEAIGIVKNPLFQDDGKLEMFLNTVRDLYCLGQWTKDEVMDPLQALLPNFNHKETYKYLDNRM